MTMLSDARRSASASLPAPRVEPAAPPVTAAPAVLRVPVTGDLDLATVARVRVRLDEALARRPRSLVVDLSRCSFVDATALTMLLEVHRACCRLGLDFALSGAGPRIQRVLSLTGLRGVFTLL